MQNQSNPELTSKASILFSTQFPVPVPILKKYLWQAHLKVRTKQLKIKIFFTVTGTIIKNDLITAKFFNDLLRDLNLHKSKTDILDSHLKQCNLLYSKKIVKVSKWKQNVKGKPIAEPENVLMPP